MATQTNDRQIKGKLGEQLVARWLQDQGWKIVALRWHSRWGEIDVIAQGQAITGLFQTFANSQASQSFAKGKAIVDTLAFVEVKTRNLRNWDQGGAEAITPQKSRKIWKTAELFLSEFPQFSQWNCRFDVALVTCEPLTKIKASETKTRRIPDINVTLPPSIELGQTIVFCEYQLTLQRYLTNAFS